MTDQEKRSPHRWTPGVSGNLKGRPRKASSLTEAIRTGVEPAELVAIALGLARNGEAESTKLGALNWLRDSGFTRPAERHELAQVEPDGDETNYAALSLPELLELDALEEKRERILTGNVLALPAPRDTVRDTIDIDDDSSTETDDESRMDSPRVNASARDSKETR